MDAILQATIQVLLAEGKEKLTTTRVADRAGVSVGTLYQYFPNKSALLQAVLQRHIADVAGAVERVCRERRDEPLGEMVTALIEAYFGAKMREPKTSAALYAVSSDLDGQRIAQKAGVRVNKAIVALFATTPDRLTKEPEMLAEMLQGAMAGVSRRLVESHAPEKRVQALRQELLAFAAAYVAASVATAPLKKPRAAASR